MNMLRSSVRNRALFRKQLSLDAILDLLENECTECPRTSDATTVVPSRTVTIDAAQITYFTGHPIRSPIDIPAVDVSIMDGYAVDEHEGPHEGFTVTIRSPFFRRVNTGMPVPAICNRVIPIEYVIVEGDEVTPLQYNSSETRNLPNFIRHSGSDVTQNSIIIPSNTPILAGEKAVISGSHVNEISVHAPINVLVVSTGNELVENGMDDAFVWDTNGPFICNKLLELNRSGMCPTLIVERQVIPDTPNGFLDIVIARKVDIIISTGAVSAGTADFVVDGVERMSEQGYGEILVNATLLKPGKPTMISRLYPTSSRGTGWHFGLPGNPQSALVMLQLIVLPFLRRWSIPSPSETLTQRSGYMPLMKQVRLPEGVVTPTVTDKQRTEWLRCSITHSHNDPLIEPCVRPIDHQRSSGISGLLANQSAALMCIPPTLNSNGLYDVVYLNELPHWPHLVKDLAASNPLIVRDECACGGSQVEKAFQKTSAVPHISVVVCSTRLSAGMDGYVDLTTSAIDAVIKAVLPDAVIVGRHVIGDTSEDILSMWRSLTVDDRTNVLIYSGGTGATDDDMTPDVIAPLLSKRFAGIETKCYMDHCAHTPMAALSRVLVGSFRNQSQKGIVCCIPGSPKGAKEVAGSIAPYFTPLLNQLHAR